MTVTLTWQTVITASAVVTAIILLVSRFAKGVRWFDRQNEQTSDIQALEEQHNADVKAIKDELAKDMRAINKEQALIIDGILACLKGLQEKGCNGPVTKEINKIEDYLNQKAHEH